MAGPFVNSDTHWTVGGPLVTADFNGDGDPDLATLYATSVRVLAGGTGGTFSAPVAYDVGPDGRALEVADVNGDGDPDLVVGHMDDDQGQGGRIAVLLGGAGATFGAPSTVADTDYPLDLEAGDFNGDGDPDIAVAGSGLVLTGGAGATFTAAYLNLGGSSVDSGDFNGDGDLDLVGATNGQLDAEVRVMLGGAGATFADPTFLAASGPATSALLVGEFNGDNDPDIAVAHTNGTTFSIFLGATGGTFSAPASFAVGGRPEEIAAGDFNGDGDPDLVLGKAEGGVSLFLGGTGGSFSHGPDVNAPRAHGLVTGDFNADGDRDFAVTSGSTFDGVEVGSVSIYTGREPTVPAQLATTPGSPAKDTTPQITGTADDDATVRIYTTADCSGPLAAIGTGATLAAPGLTVTVPAGSTTTFHVTAADGLSMSACAASSVSYTDSSPSLNLTADTHPEPGQPVPFTASGIAHMNSAVFYIATTPGAGCAATYDQQYGSGQGYGLDSMPAGPYSFTTDAPPTPTRFCAYLYEQEPCPGVYCGSYDLSGQPDAVATVVTSNGPYLDSDGDGFIDRDDACPNTAGPGVYVGTPQGCPPVPVTPPPSGTGGDPSGAGGLPTGGATFPSGGFPTAASGFGAAESEGDFDGGELHELMYTVPAKASLKKFLKKGVLGSLSCVGCGFTAKLKISAALARKLKLKSATIGTMTAPEVEGTVSLKFRLSTSLKAKLAKLPKVVVTVSTTVVEAKKKTVLAAKKTTLAK
jgi:hypothetical protein